MDWKMGIKDQRYQALGAEMNIDSFEQKFKN
jgi:hypothetical protein